jgi:NAD(P)-dependent dehydrogenase (short-subunit alcohol dehydrogenase family)
MDKNNLNKTVIITGASGNLGAAVARRCLAADYQVILADRDEKIISEKYSDFINTGQALPAAPVDVTDRSSMENMVDEVLRKCGRIYALVNTVGGYRAGTPTHEITDETWEFMYNLNVKSVIVSSSAVIPTLIRQNSGKIVNIASRNALRGKANSASYGAAKSAVIRITESMSAELKHHGINVNCIIPGTIDTPQNRTQMPDSDFSRWVAPESIADVILFLLSDNSRDIHAAAIPVYGRT